MPDEEVYYWYVNMDYAINTIRADAISWSTANPNSRNITMAPQIEPMPWWTEGDSNCVSCHNSYFCRVNNKPVCYPTDYQADRWSLRGTSKSTCNLSQYLAKLGLRTWLALKISLACYQKSPAGIPLGAAQQRCQNWGERTQLSWLLRTNNSCVVERYLQ